VAPAAGLHFSRELMRRMEIRDIDRDFITMHISLGSYRDIDVEDLTKHRMDSEEMDVSDELAEKVNALRDGGNKVCAIGTSVLRAFETCVGMNGHIKPYGGWSNKFLFPPYECTTCDALVTNFHMPYSIMLMAQASFGGYDQTMEAYKVAIEEKYRFGAYGDAMLILND
jgi:S-adenosylmethionine:tRNA ribosyltransferase-isomerase